MPPVGDVAAQGAEQAPEGQAPELVCLREPCLRKPSRIAARRKLDEWAADVGRSMEPFELKMRHHLAPTAAVTALARGVPCKLVVSLLASLAERAPRAPGGREAGVRTPKGFTRASLDMPH